MKNMKQKIVGFVILIALVATAWAIPPCTYTDPVVAVCEDTSPPYNITCRMIEAGPGQHIAYLSDCSYLWCDTSVPCATNSQEYQRKIRTKKLASTDQEGCRRTIRVYEVSDELDGCCYCEMSQVSWPPEN